MLCVCLCSYHYLFDNSDELDAHTETLRDIPCLVIITNLWTHLRLWLTNHTLLWSPTEYFNEIIHSLLQITQIVMHSRVRCSNAAQSWANAHTTPCVWGPVYFAHNHMSQRSYWKWKIHSNKMSIYMVLHIATKNGDFTIWEELQTLTLKRMTHYFISRFLRTRRVWNSDALPSHVNYTYCRFSHFVISFTL